MSTPEPRIIQLKKHSNLAGRFWPTMLLESLVFRIGPTKLGLDDYLLYGLYRKKRFTWREKLEFVSWRKSRQIDLHLNETGERKYANNKLLFAQKMQEHALQTPKIIAIYPSSDNATTDYHSLRDTKDLESFLSNADNHPCFVKPIHGTFGKGAFSVTSSGPTRDVLVCGDGKTRPLQSIIEEISAHQGPGYLVQRLLIQHLDVETLIGPNISSLRLVTLKTSEGFKIHRATWRLATKGNMSDNFSKGRSGNLVACINPSNGTIEAVCGMQDGIKLPLTQHPDTGVDLVSRKVPLWAEARDFCLKASNIFPTLGLQHWDIALCDTGPVAIELNVEGGVATNQLAGDKGFYDDELKKVLRETPSP